MSTHEPIAYTYEADYHCPHCTAERFGRGPNGFIAEDREDAEGNPVGAVFTWDEWWGSDDPVETLSCGDCFEELGRVVDEDAVRSLGREAGVAAGSWITDGNSSEDDYRRILDGFEDGDPEIMDLEPAPLSGEFAGESIPELSDRYGIPLADPDIATLFEDGFTEGFWAEVIRACRYQLEGS